MLKFLIIILLSSNALDATPPTYADLAQAATERTTQNVTYAPSYVRIPYPMGDVPKGTGVCTDVVIRSYRKLGIDLQQLVHEDMKKNFDKYQNYGDSNAQIPILITVVCPIYKCFSSALGSHFPLQKPHRVISPEI